MGIRTLTVNPKWIKGKCRSCGKIIYIDERNKRTFHQIPLCSWYTKYCSKGKSEGEVELLGGNH